MNKQYLIRGHVLQALVDYLSVRPWVEVREVMQAILNLPEMIDSKEGVEAPLGSNEPPADRP